MRKLIEFSIYLLIVCQTISSTILNAQTKNDNSISGIWLGKLVYPKYEQRIAIKISENENGKMVATLIHLDVGSGEVPIDLFTYDKDSLNLKLYDIEIKGKVYVELGRIESQFFQNSDKLSLELKRIDKLPQYNKIKDLKIQALDSEAFSILAEIFEYDRGIPFDSRTVETKEIDGYLREKIVFSGIHDCRIPGYLSIPKSASPPYPVIIAVHGLTGSKDTWWEDDDYTYGGILTKSLLKEGYAILTLDAPYHGERKAFNDFEPPSEITWIRNWYHKFRDFTIQAIIEHRRAIDYLETRSEFDVSKIGVIGYSMGSTIAFDLTGLDSRVKTTVVCVLPILSWPSTLVGPYNFANKINGRPILMLMGTEDSNNYTTENAKLLLELINSSDKDIIFYEGGHRLPVEYIEKTVDWFKENL